jgi:flagellar biosynthesis/type III secretory pathway protein FliH
MQENDRNREWQSGEAGANRDWQSVEARKNREFERRQARLTREQQMALANKVGRGGGGGGSSMDDWLAKQEYLAGMAEQERQAQIAAAKKAGGNPLVNSLIGAGGSFLGGFGQSLGTKLGGSF